MSAKNGAINVMICLTAMSFFLYRRANRELTISWVQAGNIALATLFFIGMANVVWLAIYGFYIPAHVRVGLSVPQGATTATVVLAGLWINHLMLKGSRIKGPVQWGKISVRGMVVLFGVAAAFTWVMGLMGYIRSAGRLGWHVNELLPDLSPWAFTPTLAFAAKMVTPHGKRPFWNLNHLTPLISHNRSVHRKILDGYRFDQARFRRFNRGHQPFTLLLPPIGFIYQHDYHQNEGRKDEHN